MLPYTTQDYRLAFCQERARELRASGKYASVHVRKRRPEIIDGETVEFGRIYVERNSYGMALLGQKGS